MKRERERRSGNDRRSGKERRRWARRADDARELYQSDLDRHFWSWPMPSAKARRRKRRLKLAGVLASAAGVLGAAGISYLFYRRRHDDAADGGDADVDRKRAPDPQDAEGSDD